MSFRHVLNLTNFVKWSFKSVIKYLIVQFTQHTWSAHPLSSLTSSCCASKSKQCVRALHMLRAVATTSVSFSLIFNKLPVVEKENKTLNVGLSNFSSKWKVRESEKEKSYKIPLTPKNTHATCHCRKKKTLMHVKWGEKNVMHTQVLEKKILENPDEVKNSCFTPNLERGRRKDNKPRSQGLFPRLGKALGTRLGRWESLRTRFVSIKSRTYSPTLKSQIDHSL